jgi:NAD(P)-dependent dehydrogenase (short-subunit alcohol dehydrogenase family)
MCIEGDFYMKPERGGSYRCSLDLGGRAGIVTGAASGMGREIALRLARDGACLVAADTAYEPLCELREEILQYGGEARAVRTDVSRENDVKHMTQVCMETYGAIDFMVSNAGVVGPYTFEETSVGAWDRVFAVNTRGGYLCARHVLPHMERNGSGRVIFNASTNGAKAGKYVIAYRSSKAALIMLARSLALHAAPFGITVNAICPGVTATPMQRNLVEELEKAGGMSYGDYTEERKKRIPMGRFTEVSDIADITEFLLSDNAKFITGQAIFVNGGEW